jgi:hypothetical protein
VRKKGGECCEEWPTIVGIEDSLLKLEIMLRMRLVTPVRHFLLRKIVQEKVSLLCGATKEISSLGLCRLMRKRFRWLELL